MPRRLTSKTNNLTGHFINGTQLHPYLKRDFWLNTANHFWESPIYTERAKEYFRSQLQTIEAHGMR